MASAANHKATSTHEDDNDSIEGGLMIGIELQPKHFPRARHLMYTIEMEDVVNQSLPLSDKLMERSRNVLSNIRKRSLPVSFTNQKIVGGHTYHTHAYSKSFRKKI